MRRRPRRHCEAGQRRVAGGVRRCSLDRPSCRPPGGWALVELVTVTFCLDWENVPFQPLLIFWSPPKVKLSVQRSARRPQCCVTCIVHLEAARLTRWSPSRSAVHAALRLVASSRGWS